MHDVVKNNWKIRIQASLMYRVVRSKNTSGNFKGKLESTVEKLLYVENKLTQSPNSAQLNN